MAPNSIFLQFAFLVLLSTNPSHGFEVSQFARNHLKSFGYLPHHNASADDTLESALRTYQRFYRLNVTGRVEPDTLASMIRPRCGVPDRHPMDPVHQVSPAYTFLGDNVWPPSKRTLTYWFNTPVLVPIDTLRTALSNAFSSWSTVSTFYFKEAPTAERPDLVIGFFSREHGDEIPFDGPRGALAHAFSPMRGVFHYDADEKWSTNPGPSEFDIETLSLHEIGHLLGLGHSADKSAIMFAYFNSGETKRLLQMDDINGIFARYPQG